MFFHNSLQPLPRLHQETFKALNAMQVYSHSYWLVIFCTTNSSRVLARERWQTFENSWKKTQYLMNTLYVHIVIYLKLIFQMRLLLESFSVTEPTSFFIPLVPKYVTTVAKSAFLALFWISYCLVSLLSIL